LLEANPLDRQVMAWMVDQVDLSLLVGLGDHDTSRMKIDFISISIELKCLQNTLAFIILVV
jgi:hypothetical protein